MRHIAVLPFAGGMVRDPPQVIIQGHAEGQNKCHARAGPSMRYVAQRASYSPVKNGLHPYWCGKRTGAHRFLQNFFNGVGPLRSPCRSRRPRFVLVALALSAV